MESNGTLNDGRQTRARKAGRKIDDVPGTITHRKVADKLGVAPEMIRRWVECGEFPRPLAVVGVTWLYREDLIREFLKTGTWGDGATFNRPATRGEAEGEG